MELDELLGIVKAEVADVLEIVAGLICGERTNRDNLQ